MKPPPSRILPAHPNPTPSRALYFWPQLWPVLVIVLAGWWVYMPALAGGWIWDDYPYIVQNPALTTLAGLRSIWFAPTGVNYFPVTFTVQWLQWHIWGDAPLGYHITNLTLHLGNSLLLWRVLSRLGVRRAWLGGLLWAIHPLAVESVAWISELKNVLALGLVLAALEAWLDFAAGGARRSYILALAFYLPAMLSKSTVVMFPAALLLVMWYQRRRLRWRDIYLVAPFFVISLGLGIVTVHFEHRRAMAGLPAGDPLFERLAGAGAALGFYLYKSVLPVGLSPIYAKPPLPYPWLWLFAPWAILIGLVAALARGHRAWSAALVLGLGWFLLNLIPTLGFIPMAYLRIAREADHFAYMALPGVVGLAVAGLALLVERLDRHARIVIFVVGSVVVVLLGSVARDDARVYESERTLWSAVLVSNPASWLAHNHLGAVWMRERKLELAREEFAAAVQLAPEYVEAHNNLGLAHESAGELPQAIAEFERARALRPGDPAARHNLAAAHALRGAELLRENRPADATLAFAQSLQLEPDSYTAHNNLGIALAHLGNFPEAITQYEAALQLKWDYPEALTNLGNVLLRSGRTSEAVARYEAALRLAPQYAPARDNLRIALSLLSRAGR